MFSSRNSVVSGLTFRSLIYFELIFVYGNFCIWCRILVQFHSFARSWSVFPTPFIEETVLYPLYILDFFVVS